MKSLLILKILLLSLLISCNSYAENNLPYQEEATLYEINYETGFANIGDLVFSIPLDIKINTQLGEIAGINNLKANTTIGYTQKGNVITEIWVLDRPPVDHSINDD